jgi:peptidoglycan LD-endopeptidase LytH
MKLKLAFFLAMIVGGTALFTHVWRSGNGSVTSAAPMQTAKSISQLTSPIEGLTAARLSDTFTESHNGHVHEAIDIMAPRGTPVHAVVDGVIKKLFLSKPGGITIYQFDRDSVYCYYYAHLDRYAADLKEGMQVHRGDVIAYVGSTGDAQENAPHLHFEISKLNPEKQWWKGEAINPYPILKELVERAK